MPIWQLIKYKYNTTIIYLIISQISKKTDKSYWITKKNTDNCLEKYFGYFQAYLPIQPFLFNRRWIGSPKFFKAKILVVPFSNSSTISSLMQETWTLYSPHSDTYDHTSIPDKSTWLQNMHFDLVSRRWNFTWSIWNSFMRLRQQGCKSKSFSGQC